jgi:hypothetical protein
MADVGFSCRTQWRDEFGRFAQALDVGAQRSQQEAGEIGAVLAAGLAPKRSGFLASTIRATGHGFAAGAGYAAAQEKGAGPHPIGAPGQVLGNEDDDFGPVRGPVLHPGNPATHFMRNALRMVNQRLMGIIRANMPG